MAERSYALRDVLDKLGIGDETRVATEGPVDEALLERAARRGADVDPEDRKPVDVVLWRLVPRGALDPAAVESTLRRLAKRIVPAGGIWLLTAKKGAPDYVKQEDLIPLGKAAGLVDNKVCAVDEATSAIRFVIPRAKRG